MAKIQFTKEDLLGIACEIVRIEAQADCDGEICGARPELMLPAKEYQRFVEAQGARPPICPHWHLVVSRDNPDSRRHHFYVGDAAVDA